ncbi:MAG: PilZ domain-containing protein [Candidatus Omnitrophota bacterium]
MENEKKFEEKRKFARLNTSVDVQYTVLEIKAAKEAKTKDISAGGICIIADEKLEVDCILGISVYLSGESMPITAKGKVVWTRPFQVGKENQHFDVGVEFTEISPEDRKKIDQYVFSFLK